MLVFVRWSLRRNKNAQQWNKEPTKLGRKCTGASLGQHSAWGFPQLHRHTLWSLSSFPSEQRNGNSHRLLPLSVKGKAGTQKQGFLCMQQQGLLRVFCILWDVGKPS